MSSPAHSSSLELYAVYKNSDESESVPYACLEARRKLRSYAKLVNSVIRSDIICDSIDKAVDLTREDSPLEPSVETSQEVPSRPNPLRMKIKNNAAGPSSNLLPPSDTSVEISFPKNKTLEDQVPGGGPSGDRVSSSESDENKGVDQGEEETDSSPEVVRSSLTPRKLKGIAKEFYIPSKYKLIAPSRTQVASKPPIGLTTVYKGQLQCGLRFPLTSFINKIITFYKLNLAQLIPNAIRALVAFETFCRFSGVESTVSLFRYYYSLRNSIGERGWFYFSRRSASKAFLPPH